VALEDKFLIYSNARLGEIKAISLNQSLRASSIQNITHEVIQPITDLERPVALDYHRRSQYIYYSDAARGHIRRRKVDAASATYDAFIISG